MGAAALACACSSNTNSWHLTGKIEGVDSKEPVVLEGNNQGYWYPLDTIETQKDGSFKYEREAQGYPDIYRLRIGKQAVYFPIDSIETVNITATAPDIAANHTISGSKQALALAHVDSLINSVAAKKGVSAMIADQDLKRALGEAIVADPAGIVAYYIISKNVDGRPLFNPAEAFDNRLIGAVANSFSAQRPGDPRTAYLTRLYLANRKPGSNPVPENVKPLQAREVRAFDIKLFDNAGREHSLLDETAKGKVVVLNFTAYVADQSPAYNVALNKLYEKYKAQGFEIFQVSVDTDEYLWKQTAKNLPWITVLNDLADTQNVLRVYNVGALPTSFVFNRAGEVVERPADIAELDKAIAKYL